MGEPGCLPVTGSWIDAANIYGVDLTCDVSFCDQRANVIHNGVKLCRSHHDDPEWAV